MGLHLQTMTKQLAEYFQVPEKHGVLVAEVEKDSRSSTAGFQAGDVITKVEGSTIKDIDDLIEEVSEAEEGKELQFDIIRKGKPLSLRMTYTREDDLEDSSFEFFEPHENSFQGRDVGIIQEWLGRGLLDRVEQSMRRIQREWGGRMLDMRRRLESRLKGGRSPFLVRHGRLRDVHVVGKAHADLKKTESIG